MDPVTQSKVDKTVGLIIDPVFGFVKRHFGYLISYKKRIQELEAEIGKLRDERERIQRRVDRATENAEVIEDDVSKWLKEVETMEADVTKFLADKVKENKMCFKCWCPDFSWRHRLGKGAQEKKEAVIRLKVEGGTFEMLPVAHPAPYPAELQLTSTGDYMIFDSRNSVFNAIMEALKESRSFSIGVHGPGGVGKTKMVEEIAKKAKEGGLFHEIVLAVVSKDADIRKIQEQLASQLNLTYRQDSEVGRAGQLWQRLKEGNKKMLVILDDIWEELDCKKIGIPISDGDKGCKIVLTTRKKEVCEKMEVQKEFSIAVLQEPEAWTLFMKVLGNVAIPESKAKKVCEECGGLPVAIIAIAAALKGKQGYAWDDALEKLKNSNLQDIEGIDPKIYMSLK